MHTTANEIINQLEINPGLQIEECVSSDSTSGHLRRPEKRRRDKEAARKAKKAEKMADQPKLTDEQRRILETSMEELSEGMVGETWKTLEMGKHFKQNQKIALISDDTLVIGTDVASEKHDMRAFTHRGIEVSEKAFEFANSREGFESALAWILELMNRNGKKQAVMGLEPTGHYWMNLYQWMTGKGITVVLVNPFAVNRIKEVDDNQQLKTDLKDPKTIASLVRDGRYSVPYLPEDDYAELRGYAQLRDRANEQLVQAMNRLHRWTKIYFPVYDTLYSKIDAEGGLLLLEKGLVPEDLVALGAEGINQVWRDAKLRGTGLKRARDVYDAAKTEITYAQGKEAAREEVKWLAADIRTAKERLETASAKMQEYCLKVADIHGVLKIPGVTAELLAPLLADLGDLSRFENDEEIAKLSGLVPVLASSGKYKGQAKISRRGRKRIRKSLYKLAKCVVRWSPEFKAFQDHYMKREKNPLGWMQALMVVMRKLLRVIRKLIMTGTEYDPAKMLAQVKKMEAGGTGAA